MKTLAITLKSVLQSWCLDYSLVGSHRYTNLKPSKSAIQGLICSALGEQIYSGKVRRFDDVIKKIAESRFAVRIDQPHESIFVDYETAKWEYLVNGELNTKNERKELYKSYLVNACFVVFIENSDDKFLEKCRDSLIFPYRPLYLGRKRCIPSYPLCSKESLLDMNLDEAVRKYPLIEQGNDNKKFIVEKEVPYSSSGQHVMDCIVVLPNGDRRKIGRKVQEEEISLS